MAQFQTGQANYAASQVAWNPIIQPTPRTSYSYTFTDTGRLYLRNNNNMAMSDTISQPAQGTTPNGWYVYILNLDPVSMLTLTPAACLINNQASVVLRPLEMIKVLSDGINFYASLSTSTLDGGGVQGIPPVLIDSVPRFASTDAELIQSSPMLISDVGIVTGVYRISVSDGSNNCGVGLDAGISYVSGSQNVAMGTEANNSTTNGSDNIALGFQALELNLVGNRNVGIGSFALSSNLADNNVAIGYNALGSSTTAEDNVAIGSDTLSANISGNQNVAIGTESLTDNTTGINNMALGFNTLSSNIAGTDNISIGANTSGNSTSGNFNTIIGSQSSTTNISNTGLTIIGAQSNTAASGNNYSIGLGWGVQINAPNKLFIGSATGGQGLTTQPTVGAAGGASALPATPTTYLPVNVNGTNYVLPLYAAS